MVGRKKHDCQSLISLSMKHLTSIPSFHVIYFHTVFQILHGCIWHTWHHSFLWNGLADTVGVIASVIWVKSADVLKLQWVRSGWCEASCRVVTWGAAAFLHVFTPPGIPATPSPCGYRGQMDSQPNNGNDSVVLEPKDRWIHSSTMDPVVSTNIFPP